MLRFSAFRTVAAYFCWSPVLGAQGLTSAAIAGRILGSDGRGVQGADVVVSNESTGLSMRDVSRAQGRYVINGLEPGGPYRVVVRRIGSPVVTKRGIVVSLGQQLQVDVVLEEQPVTLRRIETFASRDRRFSRARTGTETLLTDSVIHRTPTLNRDLYDLILLVPQMSTWFPLTASGAGPRSNSIRIDGVSDQLPTSNLAAGAIYGGKVIPLDAVEEYQVLLSPFDVRYGSFAGAGVNVVTRSGSNTLHGNVFGLGTNERLGANVPLVRGARYEKRQFGFSLGGPIVQNRLHFFVASEFQQRAIPAPGSSVDQSHSVDNLPVSIERFQQILDGIGLPGGSAANVTNANPSSSVFLRIDAPVSRWNSRVTLRANYGNADSSIFSRPTTLAPTNCPNDACYPLSSLQHSRWLEKRSVAAQFISNFANGASNEFVAGYTGLVSGFHPTVMQPLILVTVPGPSGAPAVLQSGTHEIATGQHTRTWSFDVNDNLSISMGAHRVAAGFSARPFGLRAFQLRGSYGVWEFASLDSLQSGSVAHYRVTRDTGSVTAASGGYHAVYLSDEWDATSRLSLTLGLRADLSTLSNRPPYVAAVDSIFHQRTDAVPSGNVQWSPRVGFNYDLSSRGDARAQLRGGAGIFSGQAPLFWLFGGFAGYGLAARTLQCGSLPGDAGPSPKFHPVYDDPPMACGGGQTFGAATNGEVDVIDSHLRLPQSLRASLAFDAELPFGVIGTIEGLYTRATSTLFFSSINLAQPVASDRHGRVLYGAFTASGVAVPNRVSPALGNVITIANQSQDRAYDVTTTLRKQSMVADVDVSFSYGRSRDVQSPRPVSALLADDWRFGRPVAGRQDDLALSTSDFDQPARVRVFGTVHSPWRRFGTDVTFAYVGGSGVPYTYVAGGTQGRDDLNADGAVGNDPIYVPRATTDISEIVFAGSATEVAAQQAAFDRFVDGAKCLRAQRGSIMSRNSCRSPWMNMTNAALQQTLPSARGHTFTLELQVFNVLNLLNSEWGRIELPTGATLTSTNQIALLSQVGETSGPLPQPIYRFDTETSRYSNANLMTYYQVQLAARYAF